ncbi:hypothetical protein BU24DRAFT_342923 [Aaosphaeria arxii CBS 175.79]|uniref:Uncharacterized protein n=1 Tax=Aaosphaeria arxii CBS 175.79 TaxID=1450172 RepID=A0A6A5Y2E2_9PLEO|nr:uncharacterized protein BU24DRAFT_342923 [Aaosphaeria arxii CBS 175.79]KAF2019702.1 hypothetical protein BU24DRAFT_342923 [Aaosphaeria arxii CBS 175.79]
MNRFLTRRKGENKKKKSEPEPEPKIDIAVALPPSDDFRTSLIMPSLSTRFSMLREQDDPSSLIGKASDDSVLAPKRQSRLHEFGFVAGGLSDIAEVSSLNGSIRPPFATERSDSFDSSDGSGSMMSRARPGEGNVLFGGRQKIYKISNAASSKNLGRALYEDDVAMSSWQKSRAEERERQLREEQEAHERQTLESQMLDTQTIEPISPVRDSPYSPSFPSYDQKRETSSSTNSGTANTRTSTAATSIASQGAGSIPAPSPALPTHNGPASPTDFNRAATKARRLYDQGLDQHMQDQQSSAMNRLNSIQRTRAPTGRSTPPLPFNQTRSATNLNDRFNRSQPLRTESPAPSGKDVHSNSSSPIISRPQSPPLMSPVGSDIEEAQTLNSALQPNDRGKATALGAFNKPKQAFNEQQYAERMRRLQQEREAPVAAPPSASKLDKPAKPSLRERAEQERRKRAEAGAVERQRSGSAADEKEAASPFSVFQKAANQMKATPVLPLSPLKKTEEHAAQKVTSPPGTTFFASPGSSDDEDDQPQPLAIKPTEPERRPQNIPVASGPAPPILEHPAWRSRSNSQMDDSKRLAPLSRDAPRNALQTDIAEAKEGPEIDSPTLGDNGGLSGLIRQHLRNVSNVSSDYGDGNQVTMSPPATSTNPPLSLYTQNVAPQRQHPASETDTPAHSSYTHSNPWDLDDLDNPYYGERDSTSSTSPVEAHKTKAPNAPSSSIAQALQDDISEWERDMRKTHKREPSVEEREAFQRELALRQRAIQDSLRGQLGQDHSRAAPVPGQPHGGLKNALNMLRAKSSRESFATVNEQRAGPDSKAMRMLGIGNAVNGSSTSLAGPYGGGDHWRSENHLGHREPPLRQKPSRVLQQSEQDAQRELESRLQQRPSTDDVHRDSRSNGRTPTSSRPSTRDRSSSEVSSGRSRSRPGHYRDDLEQAMAEGTGSRNTVYPANTMPSVPGYVANPTQPLPSERSSPESQARMRSRSNSRTAKHLQPLHTGIKNGASPHLSPAGTSPMPPFSPGLPASPRPSPGATSPNPNVFRPHPSPVPPFAASNTPPVSGSSTPVAASFNTNAGAGAIIPSTATLRKKSINKADISEPIFLSTTSVIDTVNLPPGASLKNGGDAAPPVPPINPMRRRFGFGRTANEEPAVQAPFPPYAEPMRTNSSDALASQNPPPRNRLRKTSSAGDGLHSKAQAQMGASPAVPPMPFGRKGSSPPRPINDRHIPQAQHNMDGAMF